MDCQQEARIYNIIYFNTSDNGKILNNKLFQIQIIVFSCESFTRSRKGQTKMFEITITCSMLPVVSGLFHGCFRCNLKVVPRVLQGCVKGVAWVLLQPIFAVAQVSSSYVSCFKPNFDTVKIKFGIIKK